jgi:imidazolonepropionase-like amidohydrolase
MPEAAPWRFKQVRTIPRGAARAERLILRGRLFTGENRGVLEDGFVQVEGSKITGVGRQADLGSGGDGAVEVGGAGATILPGLFNNHAHLAWDGANDLATQALDDAPEISAYKCAANMLRSLRAGVTTVRDLGMNKAGFFAKQAVAQGVFPGPKLVICGEEVYLKKAR